MLKKLAALLSMVVLVLAISTAGSAKDADKEGRVEGLVVRHSSENSTLTVRALGQSTEKTVQYDPSTKWTSQHHGAKKVNTIDASQVHDDDYVICTGSYGEKGVFHATQISKRLSHSPAPR